MGTLISVKRYGDSEVLDELTVVLGNVKRNEVSGTGKTVILGKCARRLAHLGVFARGCPPMCDEIIRAFCSTTGSDADIVIASLNQDRSRRWDDTKHLLYR